MEYVLIVLVFCLGVVSSSDLKQHKNYHLIQNEKCGTTPVYNTKPFVADGRYASFGQFPWIVKVYFNRQFENGTVHAGYCGGAVINKKYILSVAHCFRKITGLKKASWDVVVGDLNSTTDPDCDHWCAPRVQRLTVQRAIVHPEFKRGKVHYDISLLRLERRISYSEFVIPICLPFDFVDQSKLDEVLQDKMDCCDFAGWGKTSDTDPIEPTRIKSGRGTTTRCKPESENSYYICGLGLTGRPCHGDSGAPLTVKTRTEDGFYKNTAVGVASFINGLCKRTTTVTYFTKITVHLKWILDHIHP